MAQSSKASKGSKGSAKVAKASPVLAFVVTRAARPHAGNALASYTAAWLGLSGMATGATIPEKQVRQIAGDTAVAYHLKQGNFERTDAGLKLTDSGLAHFIGRTKIAMVPEMVKAYEAVMSTGKPDGAMVKNPEFVKPLQKD